MPHMNPLTRSLPALLAAAIGGAVTADVAPIGDDSTLSTEGLGHFSGSLVYTYLGGTSGRLDVTLTNTTAASVGGYITAFMFRTPIAAGAMSASLSAWDNGVDTGIPAGASGSPFPGSWIGGVGVGATWLSGGSPNDGIGVGTTGNWSFSISGASASTLTATSFVTSSTNSDPYAFIVRFRGMEGPDGGEGSDKVPAIHLPSPGTAALISLSGLMIRRRRP